MNNSDKQHKISRRLILYIILFSSMITAIVTVIQLFFQYTEEKTILEKNISNINTGYREGITNAVWLDDKVQLMSILDGVAALPDIEYIEVRVNNKIYASRGKPVATNAVNSSFVLQNMYDNELLTIGETYVEADLSAIYDRIISHAWTILGLNAIKTFFVAIFMYFIFDRLVVRRLETLSDHVHHHNVLDPANIKNIEPLGPDKYSDEITEISSALDTMNQHLSRSLKELLGLKTTLDMTLDSIIMFYPDNYRIFYANIGAAKMLDYEKDELMNLSPNEICPDLNKSTLSELSKRNSPANGTDQEALDILTHFNTRNGDKIPVRLVLQYLQPENEEPRFVFTARDVSERIKAQIEIQTLLDEAKAANTELESFSYSISHDLRTPLRSIDGFSLLLAQEYSDIIDDEGKDYINRVRKSAQHMGLLIDDLLSLARVTRDELHRREYDLSEMARNSIKKLREVEPNREVNVIISPGIQGWVDKSLFQNLLDNLLGNAWKYTGKTKDAVIEFGQIQKNNETVYYVCDNGAGFNMQYADKLFNAFQRLHAEEDFDGTGIGLATVYRILKRHGGRVWAEAEVNNGATFYFTIEDDNQTSNHNQVAKKVSTNST